MIGRISAVSIPSISRPIPRDDIADGGAAHIAATVVALKATKPSLMVEVGVSRLLYWDYPTTSSNQVLSPDFSGSEQGVRAVASSGLDVFAHNIETVERLTPGVRDPRAKYRQTLEVLRKAKVAVPGLVTKTSIMLGLGETDDEVRRTMEELRGVGVDCLTLGQYMQPTKRHLKVYIPAISYADTSSPLFSSTV